MIAKVLRKIGLGHAAYKLAAPFCSIKYGASDHDRDVQEAFKLLENTSPDSASSCFIQRRRSCTDEQSADLDIIIPAYNVEKYIGSCIDSVLSQKTNYSFWVLVIDDGSTDDTGNILNSYNDIRVIHQENRGLSGARNTGLEHATAEYIMFLDSDDQLCPGAIEALMGRAKEQDCAIVEGAYAEVNPEGQVLRRRSHTEGPVRATDLEGFAWGKVIRRELFSNLDFPIGYWYEDSIMRQVLYPLAESKNLTVAGTGETVLLYRQNPKGITRSSRGRSKSLDSLYITMQLFEDRKNFGLDITADYYDYILSMAVQTYSRTKFQSPEVQRAIFTVYADFLERNFSGWNTENRQLRCLEKALRERNYGDYLAYCQLH